MIVWILAFVIAFVGLVSISFLLGPKPEKRCDRCGKMTSNWHTIEDPFYEWGDHRFLTVCNDCLL